LRIGRDERRQGGRAREGHPDPVFRASPDDVELRADFRALSREDAGEFPEVLPDHAEAHRQDRAGARQRLEHAGMGEEVAPARQDLAAV
jgi:hypothetical protein